MEGVKGIKLIDINESRELFASTSEEAREAQDISNKICSLMDELKSERERMGLSQRDLASILNWKQPALARFERLEVIPRLDTFIKVARKLGGNIYIEFFGADGVPVECMKSGIYVSSSFASTNGGYSTNPNIINFGGSYNGKQNKCNDNIFG
jgi:transcriptional regulator with XRE-family HTH domain